MKTKRTVGIILMLIALVGVVVAGVCSVVYGIQNPDMTEMRQLIENPGPPVAAIICFIMYYVSIYLISDTKKRK